MRDKFSGKVTSGLLFKATSTESCNEFRESAHMVSRADLGRNDRVLQDNGHENISPDLSVQGECFPPTRLRRLTIRDGRTKPEVI